ncbi:hypothetical protein ABZZ74_49130 [Streptomyces sp. NPDC006476]|uniref:hypothetical protein n=1 Tax=Streptomyces sp. NPDC006476 TaxID=3157175 RepID=UPI0033BB5EEB
MTQHVRITWNAAPAVRRTRAGALRGVRMAVEHVLQVARGRVPIEEGTLERSGTASVDEDSLTGAVSFDTLYAVRQHEDMSLRHDAGRTAKYLEGPLNEESGTVVDIIAAQVRRELRG